MRKQLGRIVPGPDLKKIYEGKIITLTLSPAFPAVSSLLSFTFACSVVLNLMTHASRFGFFFLETNYSSNFVLFSSVSFNFIHSFSQKNTDEQTCFTFTTQN